MLKEYSSSKKYFNPDGINSLDEKIYGSNPTGFIDFNRSKYSWAKNTYDLMLANTWFPSEVNTANEKKQFELLSDNEKMIYKLTFAQLSFNDSIQSFYLTDFLKFVSNSIIKATLIKQAEQEVLHSNSYAVLLDAAGNSDEVFDLYRTNDKLKEKNQRISEQFARFIDYKGVNNMLLSAVASINLEGIYFLLGFSFIYTLGDKVAGARDMIAFISRDEINTHLPLFANIFKTIQKENKLSSNVIDIAYKMIKEAVDIELDYGKYLINEYPIMGLTEELLEKTIYNYANDRLEKIGLDPIFPKNKTTYLQKLVDKHLNMNTVKTNFFEGNVKTYAKSSINLDDF